VSEIAPQYIPCAAGNQTQTDFLIRPHGALVEILGHATMHLAPQDARKAAFALLAIADRADGRTTPHGASEAVVALVEAADHLINGATWYPDYSVGTPEMLVPTACVDALRTALEAFE
jgi:hypothetical protein